VHSIDRARELFFKYDGSRFYMSRDDVEEEYRSYDVPEQLRKQWLEELTATKLDKLEEGNWSVVYFLLHHRDTRHLPRILQATPRGSYGQRCAFLEDVLDYVKMCAHAEVIGRSQIREAAQYVLNQARPIEMDVEQDDSRERVARIIASATEMRSLSTGFPKP
jgi:hypothetical protein